jgi:triacylglycerol lipase
MNPILLVHGFTDTSKVFQTMSAYLTNLGYQVNTIDLIPSDGTADLGELAQQLKNYIDSSLAEVSKINLLGFSMGGIITRYYLQRLGGIDKVDKYINISAPNRGTILSYSLPFKGILQMRPQSQLLQDLNRDVHSQLTHIKTLIMWTPFDLMIIPANSSQLGIGQEIALPILAHKWMLSDRRVLRAIADFLS